MFSSSRRIYYLIPKFIRVRLVTLQLIQDTYKYTRDGRNSVLASNDLYATVQTTIDTPEDTVEYSGVHNAECSYQETWSGSQKGEEERIQGVLEKKLKKYM